MDVLRRWRWEGPPAGSRPARGGTRPCSDRSDELDDGGDAHAAADAERGEAAALVAALELVDERAEDHRAGGAERVPHRDGAAVDVGDLVADAHVLHEAHRDRGEGLVDLEEVDVLD